MSRITRRGFLFAAACGAIPVFGAGGRQLFNGRNLSGWHHGGRGLWRVEDGVIAGRSDHSNPGPGYLMTVDEFQDFTLSLEFRITRFGNSGVYIREPKQVWGPMGNERPGHGGVRGYEVQIDYKSKKNPTGSIYNIHPANRVAAADERWNRLEIECRGSRARIRIDDELVNDYDGLKVQPGVIGFQVHGQQPHDDVCKFRDIRLR